ncbi:ATP-dependent Clp protease proteolytic subunit [Gramella lutea]|uniref:ATP-dependent Clp protease proteolytic subunit n=1 Tax=Christiangramia lutea TaxID=1607951 RepID=A0A9X2AAB4_9FLAO|nr:ATP-dependent Clp protease proteolytic subunit [Christiangramia lutea]MCH4824290.1 ATP-dependent Clp protease proteolytic subunit [Christiangramia lutea]
MRTRELDRIIITAIAAQDITILAEQFPFEISAEEKNDKAEIVIKGAIYGWNNSAEWFRNQIQSFNEKGIKEVSLSITTPGGDVFQAAEIHNEIKAFEGKIIGYGGVIVASAGTYIRLACDEFYMVANGKWMYHKPNGVLRGNEDQVESRLKLLKDITSDYRKGYADLLSISEKQIEKNWSKGDVWLNAKEAEKEGWITGVSKYNSKITEKETAMFTACGVPDPPKPAKKKTKSNNEMDLKVTALQLGLDENATEAEVKAKMADLRAKAEKADQLELEAKQKEKDARQNEIKAILDQAQKDKKIDAKSRESLEKWANADLGGFKAHIENLPVPGKISEQISGKSAGKGAATAKDKKFEDMTAEEREALEQEDPEAFQAKYEAYLEQ